MLEIYVYKMNAQIKIESLQKEVKQLKQDRQNLATENARYMVDNDKLK